ncbi:MAG TPA: DEAD/DEAH box helicase [Nanoarchaeota archaeon]|nr:DEAD/DEAH box helicase [Nanoarchaeota archaeon]HIH63052.1 DEAD/DEAH box helicase [Nanoarchaeota archaeon]HIJ09521.1 DEAD/DEAH box helicase [Nanoarchaeota archaeon]
MNKTFKELGLSPQFIEILEKNKIIVPTEIQEKAIPLAMKRIDIIGVSSTGSGKTLVFVAPIIEQAKAGEGIIALILVPTRELAEQVATEFRKFSNKKNFQIGNSFVFPTSTQQSCEKKQSVGNKKLKIFSVYGGVSIEEHVKKIVNADVVVATPGRLLDLMNRNAVDLTKIETLVIDEFDRMLDMGFVPDVDLIVKKCPTKRHTMLFSATDSKKISSIVQEYVMNPKRIFAQAHVEASKLEQSYYYTKNDSKLSLLVYLLNDKKPESSIIFCSTRTDTDFVGKGLESLGFNVKILHGGLDQKKRTRILKEFHKNAGILVCTDVASRGLDIKNVNYIFNYDIPRTREGYIHRIGRTARAGKGGHAISIISTKDMPLFRQILEIKEFEIEEKELPFLEKIIDFSDFENPEKKKKKSRGAGRKKIKERRRKKGLRWVSIDDPNLSNRERKRSVNHFENDEPEFTKRKYKKIKRKFGSYGGKRGFKKKSNRPKGRANRKTRK